MRMKMNSYFNILFFYVTLYVFYYCKQSFQEFVEILNLNEGDICRTSQGLDQNYICTRHEMCESLKNVVVNKQGYPNICSFNGSRPIMCCPPTVGKTPAALNLQIGKKPSTAEKKCQEYLGLEKKFSNKAAFGGMLMNQHNVSLRSNNDEIIHNHTRPTTNYTVFLNFVIGVKAWEFPHVATIGYGQSIEQPMWACGGSLISERWVLTAAHCRRMGVRDLARWVRVGDFSLDSTDTYEIEQHLIHPEYRPPSLYNDIALFKVSTDVKFSSSVRPICLNWDSQSNPKVQIVMGRETELSTDGEFIESVIKINLLIMSGSQCNITYNVNSHKQLKFGILEDRMICGSSLDGKTDTCGSDSGGSLLAADVKNPGTYMQFGITSFGKYCGDKNIPGVYTRVSYYMPWIERNVWPLG